MQSVLIIKLSTQVVTAEGYEELTQDIVLLKSQIFSEAEMFNFTMKRIQEPPKSRETEDVPIVPWIFQTPEHTRPPRPTTPPSVKIPTTSHSFLTLVNNF